MALLQCLHSLPPKKSLKNKASDSLLTSIPKSKGAGVSAVLVSSTGQGGEAVVAQEKMYAAAFLAFEFCWLQICCLQASESLEFSAAILNASCSIMTSHCEL